MEIPSVPRREEKNENPNRPISPEEAEGEKIREILEREFGRRIGALKKTLAELGIAEDAVILAPPVLNRTDFGYVSDIDFAFLGEEEQEARLFEKLCDDFNLYPFAVRYDREDLVEMKEDLPELYSFLMERKGDLRIHAAKDGIPSSDFLDEAPELEARARTLQSPEEKSALKERRLSIGKDFVEEVRKKITVLGYCFSGSMMDDMDRFGSISDLDIEMLTNYKDEKDKARAFGWIHIYLKWKYAEEFGIKIDVGDTDLKSAKKLASQDRNLRNHFERQFGIDVMNA
ncbi:MAG: hypothetical protein HGA33_05415 [Candidatus Moranbacteria bacterium]|nr:hypothetical protein [Candidatus Moranbacteria bacterium]